MATACSTSETEHANRNRLSMYPSWRLYNAVIVTAVLLTCSARQFAQASDYLDEHLLRTLLQGPDGSDQVLGGLDQQGFGVPSSSSAGPASAANNANDETAWEWLDDADIDGSLDYYEYLHELGGWGEGCDKPKTDGAGPGKARSGGGIGDMFGALLEGTAAVGDDPLPSVNLTDETSLTSHAFQDLLQRISANLESELARQGTSVQQVVDALTAHVRAAQQGSARGVRVKQQQQQQPAVAAKAEQVEASSKPAVVEAKGAETVPKPAVAAPGTMAPAAPASLAVQPVTTAAAAPEAKKPRGKKGSDTTAAAAASEAPDATSDTKPKKASSSKAKSVKSEAAGTAAAAAPAQAEGAASSSGTKPVASSNGNGSGAHHPNGNGASGSKGGNGAAAVDAPMTMPQPHAPEQCGPEGCT
mmetsp:Transcript_20628/g.52355  ORF Transcript_20628/g.52355 Transcript_20628/m.52355 type:complete len:416 (-) Transcript_20628:2036-3283(-)